MSLKDWMKEAKTESENGKSLMQLSLETYLTDKLGFQLLEVALINKGYEDEFRFVVTNGENEYVFENQYYEPKDFIPHQQVLILKKISGKEGVITTDHYIWLTRDNKDDKFLSTPLGELLSGIQNDQELRYAVDYLKTAFQDFEGYEYKEEESNDLSSFVMSLNNQITIRQGFSNSIQCDFRKESFSTIQIVFKKRERHELKSELDEFIQFAYTYLDKNITLDHHDLSLLYQFLKEMNLHPHLHTNVLLSSNKSNPVPLLRPLVIETDDMSSYHQVEIRIHYLNEKKSFLMETNYLFRTFVTECVSISDLKKEIEELMHLVQVSN